MSAELSNGFAALPAFAAWRFVDAVDRFEVVYAQPGRLRGHTSAVEDGQAYAVRYEITLDDRWRTRAARVVSDTVAGPRETVLSSDGRGRWTVDGAPAPQLDGLVDVDIEASACTNTLPMHRMALPLGETHHAPAAYVRALDLSVTRLDQTYRRLDDRRYAYTSAADFRAVLEYDAAGLIIDYPGIARRFADPHGCPLFRSELPAQVHPLLPGNRLRALLGGIASARKEISNSAGKSAITSVSTSETISRSSSSGSLS